MIMRKGHFIREMAKEECTEESVLIAANTDIARPAREVAYG